MSFTLNEHIVIRDGKAGAWFLFLRLAVVDLGASYVV